MNKNIINCIEGKEAVQITEYILSLIPSLDKNFQYFCNSNDECEHQIKKGQRMYCIGNKEYEI